MGDLGPSEHTDAGLLKGALKLAGSDAARYLPVRFVPALTSLITVPLFTRAIDAADYGAFYLLNSFLVLGAGVAAEWIGTSAIRFYWPNKKAGNLGAFIATAVWMAIASLGLASAIIAGVAFLGRGYIDPLVLRLLPTAVAYFFMNYALYVFMEILRAANRASDYARLSVVATLLTNALAILFVVGLGWGAAGIFAGVAAGSAIMIPLTLGRISTEGTLAPAALRGSILRELLHYGLPFVPVGAASWALGLLDRFVIEWARGAAEVGMYSVAYGLGEKIMQLATLPLILTMTPMLVRAFEEHGQPNAQRIQTQFTRYFAIATLPLLAGLTVIAKDFMTIFTGAEYRAAYPVLAIVAGGALLVGLTQIAVSGLTIHKRSRRIMANTLVATAFNLALNLALVPGLGYTAAAYSTVAAYGLLLALTWIQSRRLMAWRIPWTALPPVIGATALMALAVWGVTLLLPTTVWALLCEGLTGIAVYAIALLALGGIRADERAFTRELAASVRSRIKGH